MSSEPILDPQAIQTLRDLNPDDGSFLRELVGMFLEDTPKRFAEIETSLAKGDLATLTRAAHSVKGSSSNFGAEGLRKLSMEIEELGKTGKLAEIPARLPEYKAEYARVQAALEALVK